MSILLVDGGTVEYELAPNMVVFSHGFGVRRHSRGMFTEICQNLPENFGYVLFDYNDIDDQNHTVRLTDFTEQIARLQKVLAWTAKQPEVKSVSIITHSMGCIVTALARPKNIKNLILLAPPTSIGDRTRKYFTTKKGAEKHDDMWVVPRSDGTVSIIPETLFDQYEAVDAAAALQELAAQNAYTLIAAGADEVIADANYEPLAANPRVRLVHIENANHDFEKNARQPLLDEIFLSYADKSGRNRGK